MFDSRPRFRTSTGAKCKTGTLKNPVWSNLIRSPSLYSVPHNHVLVFARIHTHIRVTYTHTRTHLQTHTVHALTRTYIDVTQQSRWSRCGDKSACTRNISAIHATQRIGLRSARRTAVPTPRARALGCTRAASLRRVVPRRSAAGGLGC